ncbi:MAG: S-layer homology domain-containing protein, partial [Actinomycetota bacterium]|nr:S-layer homology domain-containing protein [Actinomycetota bacterium]
CPTGYSVPREAGARTPGVGHPALQGGQEPLLEGAAPGLGLCVLDKHPESFGELALMQAQRTVASNGGMAEILPGAYAAALAEQQALAAAPSDVRGSGGRWRPYGDGPLQFNKPKFGAVNGLGLVTAAGRIDDLTYDARTGRVFAAKGTGGIWMSENKGKTWRSVGDSLPSQITGAVAYDSSGGGDGTLLALSGDPTFGGLQYTGFGAFRSTDLGKTWRKVRGIPDGALGFKVTFDPTNPDIAYAATGKGLYRSTDNGRTWTDVVLPTGDCAGRYLPRAPKCALANMVTDIVVQEPGGTGNAKGGRVIAAVGWRAGQKENPDGTVQSPANGLYRSGSGAPGSFKKLEAPGFTPQEQIGRIEFGAATGENQDHGYLYAIVEDAVAFNGGVTTLDAQLEGVNDPQEELLLAGGTVLAGVYVSADFGKTWTQMADEVTIANNPVSGSGFSQAIRALGLAPGIQAWYDLWIRPDPTRATATGVPTRLLFGMEEVWQNEDAQLGRAQNGRTEFKVIGRYFSGERCQIILEGVPVCSDRRPPTDNSTTTHPDQHDAVFIPDGKGGVTLLVGNDGGAFRQSVAAGEEFDNTKWGDGANTGFNTLLPYDLGVAKDGTVWYGLQDNGTGKIRPKTGEYIVAQGGDGFFAAVDPDNSDIAYGEFPGGSMTVTTTGGRGDFSLDVTNPFGRRAFRSINPRVTGGMFSNPFVMDPTDATHLMTAGREVVETTFGPETDPGNRMPDGRCRSTANTGIDAADKCWVQVFDLGTATRPGEPPSADVNDDPQNGMSALDLQGDAAYVGFCGVCDILNAKKPFRNGLATNVGGDKPPRRMTPDGWHIASAKGLPNRYIRSVEIDPDNPRTVYVALGGYSRRWVPPGSLQDDNRNIGEGHVFKSTDAGETFTDISGNLPDVSTNHLALRGNQLIVGTDAGMFISSDLKGGEYAVLGRGLPTAPVATFELDPGNPNRLFVATYGRSIYVYDFPNRVLSRRACAPSAVPDAGFEDIGGSVHEGSIECIAWYLITHGQGDRDGDGRNEYAPRLAVRRDQMASFLTHLAIEAGIDVPKDAPNAFADDNRSPHERNINGLAAIGLVAGKGDTDGDGRDEYAPYAKVTREQMASLIAGVQRRAVGALPRGVPDAFGDDDRSVHERNINALAALGVVNGTGKRDRDGRPRFAPGGTVSRAQMASFIANDLRLLESTG